MEAGNHKEDSFSCILYCERKEMILCWYGQRGGYFISRITILVTSCLRTGWHLHLPIHSFVAKQTFSLESVLN